MNRRTKEAVWTQPVEAKLVPDLEGDDFGVSAGGYDLQARWAQSWGPIKQEKPEQAVQPASAKQASLPPRDQLRQKSSQHAQLFEQVTTAKLERGSQLVGSMIQVFSQLGGVCGPLCFHTLSQLGGAVSGGGGISGGWGDLFGLSGLAHEHDHNHPHHDHASSSVKPAGALSNRAGRRSTKPGLNRGSLLDDLGGGLGRAMGGGVFSGVWDAFLPAPRAS